MSAVKCYDIAKMVLDEASETVAAGRQRDAYLERHISECCALFDELKGKYGASAFNVDVDERTFEISLSMEFENVSSVEVPNRPGFPLSFANKITSGCKLDEDGFTVLSFGVIFGGIWFDLSQKHEVREDPEK